MEPLYNSIGRSYSATRRADPDICQTLAACVGAGRAATYLDVACGTGSYTCALAALGGQWHGIDVSIEMLEQAKKKNQHVVWQCSSADALPYPDGAFDGAVCTLAIHHFTGLESAFAEVFRVLREGRFVVFTAFREQMRDYWLNHYFPQMMARSIEKMPARAAVLDALRNAGFESQVPIPFQVTRALQDLFLYAGKERPEIYLDPAIRANISSFATLCEPAELERGLNSLRSDIDTGSFAGIFHRYRQTKGDYAYVIANKTGA